MLIMRSKLSRIPLFPWLLSPPSDYRVLPIRMAGASRLRGVPTALGQALRVARGAGLLAAAWIQFYPRQTMSVLIRGLEQAFMTFGGVPVEMPFDQMKAVIIDDQRPVGGKLLENVEFLLHR